MPKTNFSFSFLKKKSHLLSAAKLELKGKLYTEPICVHFLLQKHTSTQGWQVKQFQLAHFHSTLLKYLHPASKYLLLHTSYVYNKHLQYKYPDYNF